eukprot:3687415-Karenia_brevis.AAC.1
MPLPSPLVGGCGWCSGEKPLNWEGRHHWCSQGFGVNPLNWEGRYQGLVMHGWQWQCSHCSLLCSLGFEN